jgi:DNA primase
MVARFHANLDASSLAGEYLEARGISPETAERWKLGYVPEGQYRNRIAIPYWTPAGYSQMVFRCLHLPGEECKELVAHDKYLAMPGYRPMFNVRALSVGADKVYVTEGELDAITASANGFPAVATGAATKWKAWWSFCFDGPREVIVLADGDDAGRSLIERVKREVRHSRGVAFPEGQDVSSYVLEKGADALRLLIEGEG